MPCEEDTLETLFDGIDVLAAPATPAPAPKIGQRIAHLDGHEEPIFDCLIRFTCPFNVSGHPVVAVPCVTSAGRLPLGLPLIGPFGRDDQLMAIAAGYERAALAEDFSRLAKLRRDR